MRGMCCFLDHNPSRELRIYLSMRSISISHGRFESSGSIQGNSSITDAMESSHREYFAIWQAVFGMGGNAHMRSFAHSALSTAQLARSGGDDARVGKMFTLIIMS
jgi:hypothetical protein